MWPIEHGHVADAVHEGARGAGGERAEERIARVAVAAGRLHLDELMVGERAGGLAGHRFREARGTQPHDRLQGVRESAQVPALPLR